MSKKTIRKSKRVKTAKDRRFQRLQDEAMRDCYRRMAALPTGAFIRAFRVLP